MMPRIFFSIAVTLIGLFGALSTLNANDNSRDTLTLLSTTSTENSGLLGYLLPMFEKDSNIRVFVVAVGTGQAIRSAKDGNGDLLMVHDPESELAFIESGYGVSRSEFMYNDYLLVGPRNDPARIASAGNVTQALQRIIATDADFLSRGDDSGTHKKELQLWSRAQLDPEQTGKNYYHSTGAGMGKTLNIAAATDAYTLTDRGTWLSFNNKQNLISLFEGDPPLFNQYSLVQINPERHSHLNTDGAQQLVNWLTSPVGQSAIAAFRIHGQQLFHPNFGAQHE